MAFLAAEFSINDTNAKGARLLLSIFTQIEMIYPNRPKSSSIFYLISGSTALKSTEGSRGFQKFLT